MTEGQETPPSWAEATHAFAKIGLLSFGGPAAQIALMHRVLVDERRWLSEAGFLNALSFCMVLPGPEAMQLASYAGWRLHGVWGGLMAGLLFVLPGAAVIFALATLYVLFGDVPFVATLFEGVQAAAVVIVVQALLNLSKRALKTQTAWLLAVLAFLGIFVFTLPFPLIVLAAGLYGAVSAKAATEPSPPSPAGQARQSLRVFVIGLVVWWLPIALLALLSEGRLLTDIALFFSQLAVVTFGGAYAVLAYMAQDVVAAYGWLSPTEMIDGLGLAETTPGPLILVTQFVGFIAGYHQGGLGLAFAAAAITLWVTFVPCFIWIFTGAPYVDRLTHQPRLAAALQAITAAVVGVILNLSLWFALNVVFADIMTAQWGWARLLIPQPQSVNLSALVLIALAGCLMIGLKRGIAQGLGITALAALALHALGV